MAHRAARIAIVTVAACCASGCTWTHRCTVPTPVVEVAPGPRVPGVVAVRHLPPAVSPEAVQVGLDAGGVVFSPDHRYIVSADAPTRALFDRLAASLFEGTAPAPPADAVLDVRLDRFVASVDLLGGHSQVAYHVVLRGQDGTEIAAFDVEGVATVAASLRHVGFCGARGEAAAVAMQDAGTRLVRRLSESDAVAAWLATRGAAPVALRVKTIAEYVEPTSIPTSTATATSTSTSIPTATSTATASGTATPRPIPVDPGPPPTPLPPRSLRIWLGAAQLRPQTTAGKLEGPTTGFSVTAFAAQSRIAPALLVDVDLEYSTRSYSAAHVPHLTGFGPRATLDGFSTGVGLRVTPPLGPRPLLEPWLGASARLLYTRLVVTYFGGLSGGDATDTAWSVGADLGAGLNLFLGGRWMLGFDVRSRVGRAHLAPLGSVGVGGWLVGGSLGAAFPP